MHLQMFASAKYLVASCHTHFLKKLANVLASQLLVSLLFRGWETDLKGHYTCQHSAYAYYHTTYTRNTFRMTVFVHSVIMLCTKRELGRANRSG